MVVGEPHGTADLLVRGRDAPRQQIAIDRKGQLARDRRHDRIADGAAALRVGDAMSGFK
jgi:hypothetical protein